MTTDIGKQIANLDRRLKSVERASRLGSASLDDTALQVTGPGGGLRAIIGQQADGTTAVNVVNGAAPPAPSLPAVASVLGGITVTWGGTFAAGATVPLDWSRVEIHASAAAGFTPDAVTLQATIETPQGATVYLATEDPLYVVLLARNTSGAASTPTAETGPTGPTPVVATDVLDGIVTTLKLADDAVTAAKVAAAAIGTTEIADGAVTTPKLIAGAVQAGKIAADAVTAGTIAANAVTARELNALAVTAGKVAANAITAGTIAAGAVSANSLTIGIAQSIAEKLNDAMADSSMWSQIAGAGTVAWLTGVTDASAGSTVAQATGAATLERQVNIPYDPDALYRVTVRVRVLTTPTAGGAISLGVTGIAADGTTRVSISGANTITNQHFIAANGVTVAAGTTWTTYTGYLKGTAGTGTIAASPDPKAPGAAQTLVRYIRPHVRLLNSSTDGVAQVDQVTVETVPTGVVNTVNIADGAITTAKLTAGSVDTAALSATAITGKTITGGTITGSTFQTAATGARITANDTGDNSIKVYNSSSVMTTSIGGANAAISQIAGALQVSLVNGGIYWADLGNHGQNSSITSDGLNQITVASGYPGSGGANISLAAEFHDGDSTFGYMGNPRLILRDSGGAYAANQMISGAVMKSDLSGSPTGRQNPTYNTNWSGSTTFNSSTSNATLQFWLDAQDNVVIEGCFKAGATLPGATVCNLPAAYRPTTNRWFWAVRYNSGTTSFFAAQLTSGGNLNINSVMGGGVAINNEYWIKGIVPLSNIT